MTTVTALGQVTVGEDVLCRLGVRAGDQIELRMLPDGIVTLRAATPAGTIEGFVGLLAGRTRKVATLGDIAEATTAGWSGQD